jgi:putative membrane protein
MKSTPILLSLLFFLSCGTRHTDEKKVNSESLKKKSEKQTKSDSSVRTENKASGKKASLTENEADFLIEASDGRLMGILEGKAATSKATTQDIRDYGHLMVKDQKTMLNDLKSIAKLLSVPLLDTISEEKQDGLEDLMEKESTKFDKKFIKMMKIDHRRDVRLFTKAKDYDNPTIKAFATRYLPMIESHLEKVKALRKKKDKKDQSAAKK